MSLQSLTPPQDITWTRLAYSRDMIDTNFGDLNFPPKWRSSLAVYFYIVPEEETVDSYPNSKIVYLKLTCSITGWNPSESLVGARKTAEDSGQLDDLQKSIWETIIASGWAEKYWPCLGAIMQIAVYPSQVPSISSPPSMEDNVGPDDYPYIMDFEPKKRELYEQVTEGGEVLSGSSDQISITKGSTNAQDVGLELTAKGSFFGLFGGEAKATGGLSWQQVNNNTTDTSRERRETLSHTSTFSQMYQLFNGYHLGTNRALFVVSPRPHIVSTSNQIEGSLINGERKLEGIQDVFLVIHMPKNMSGFCVQASIDTGHLATTTTPHYLARKINDNEPQNDPQDDPTNPPPPPLPPSTSIKQLVVTRRIVQSCGTFDANGNFTIIRVNEPPTHPVVTGEIQVKSLPTKALLYKPAATETDNKKNRIDAANNLNTIQNFIVRSILDNFSAGNYTPRNFEKTDVFKSLAALETKKISNPIEILVQKGYIDDATQKLLLTAGIKTIGDIFSEKAESVSNVDIKDIRNKIIAKIG